MIDRKGQPVPGAAIALGRDVVYSNDRGEYLLHTKHPKLDVRVMPEEFAAAGSWHVIDCPTTSQAGAEITIVVSLN